MFNPRPLVNTKMRETNSKFRHVLRVPNYFALFKQQTKLSNGKSAAKF